MKKEKDNETNIIVKSIIGIKFDLIGCFIDELNDFNLFSEKYIFI